MKSRVIKKGDWVECTRWIHQFGWDDIVEGGVYQIVGFNDSNQPLVQGSKNTYDILHGEFRRTEKRPKDFRLQNSICEAVSELRKRRDKDDR